MADEITVNTDGNNEIGLDTTFLDTVTTADLMDIQYLDWGYRSQL